MKIKTVHVELERKINVAPFESASVQFGVWADLDDGDSPGDAVLALLDFSRNVIKRQAYNFMGKHDKAKEISLELPENVLVAVEPVEGDVT